MKKHGTILYKYYADYFYLLYIYIKYFGHFNYNFYFLNISTQDLAMRFEWNISYGVRLKILIYNGLTCK